MKKLITIMAAVAAFTAVAEYAALTLANGRTAYNGGAAQALRLEVNSTASEAAVTVSVVRVAASYTNCVQIIDPYTNAIGEVSALTNRWMALEATREVTNRIAGVKCSDCSGGADATAYIFGGDTLLVSGVATNGTKATLIIKK